MAQLSEQLTKLISVIYLLLFYQENLKIIRKTDQGAKVVVQVKWASVIENWPSMILVWDPLAQLMGSWHFSKEELALPQNVRKLAGLRNIRKEKSCIRETLSLLTCANSFTDTRQSKLSL